MGYRDIDARRFAEWENIITVGAAEKNDVIFSKRQAYIQ